MLRASSYSRYAVKLKSNLPRGHAPVPVLPRSFSSTAQLCEALLEDCRHTDGTEPTTAPWQRVRFMQVVSIHNVISQLSNRAGVKQIERLFEKDWNLTRPLGRTMGRGRAGKRGQNLPTNRSLTTLEERLSTLYDGHRWPLYVDCYQLLWLSLLVDRPILNAAVDLLAAHQADAKYPNFANILTMGLPILSKGSTWKFSLWVGTQHASLPYLAECIVLLRVCAEKRQTAIAHLIAEVVCQLLAMLGPELQDRGIGAPMLRYCTENVLPLGGVHSTPSQIAHAAAVLNLAALAPWADEGDVEWKNRMRMMSNILRGNFDIHLKYFSDPLALAMPRALVADWTRSLREARIKYKGTRTSAKAYRDRVIDMSDLFARVPAMVNWLRSDPRFATTKRSTRARPPSWCDGLSGVNMGNYAKASRTAS